MFVCLFVCLTLLYHSPEADADIRALAAVPNPIAGAAVMPGKHRNVTITYNTNGDIIDLKEAGIYLVVNAGVVADGFGQIAMTTSGELKKGGKTVTTLSEGQTIESIGWNFFGFHFNELTAVYCSAVGVYNASKCEETGSFILEGLSIYASTTSRSKVTIKSGVFSIESGGGSSTIKSSKPMKASYPFSIGCTELHQSRGEDDSGDEDGSLGIADQELPAVAGLWPVGLSEMPSPGSTYNMLLNTDSPYYWVDLYVQAPWETSSTSISSHSGDGTSNSVTFSYTFPSGAMNTGDFLITATIYRWSDMSYYEETHTVPVEVNNTPNCNLCLNGCSSCQ